MENIIYTDADLNAFLLANEEQTGNTIAVVIEADATADQELTITAGEATTTETVTPSTKNRIEVPSMLWNFGDDTVITLSKGGTDVGTITIHFPAAIDTDAALNETETDNEFTLQGSASVQDQIISLQDSVERVSAQTLAYILPTSVDQSGITDGGSNTVETFDFEAGAENVKVAFFTCVQFLATTTVTAANAYEDLDVTVTLTIDGNPIATILQAYRDGRQVLTLNHLVENLSKGNHTLTVAIAAAGGSVSVMQIVAAYLLTAKSTGGGSQSTASIYTNGDFAPGVLPDGLNKDLLTKEAYDNQTQLNILKIAKAQVVSTTPSLQELSAYFLSDYVLVTEMLYGKEFYTFDGMITRDALEDVTGSWDTHFNIPIKRLSGFNRISCEVLNTGADNIDNAMAIFAVAIINGVAQIAGSNLVYNAHEWTQITGDISALPYVDYVQVFASYGKPYFRNIRLLKV